MKMLSKKSGCYFKQLPFAGLSGGMGAVLLTIKNKLNTFGTVPHLTVPPGRTK